MGLVGTVKMIALVEFPSFLLELLVLPVQYINNMYEEFTRKICGITAFLLWCLALKFKILKTPWK